MFVCVCEKRSRNNHHKKCEELQGKSGFLAEERVESCCAELQTSQQEISSLNKESNHFLYCKQSDTGSNFYSMESFHFLIFLNLLKLFFFIRKIRKM